MSVDFSGVWQANLARSRLAGPAPQSVLIKIAQSATALRQAILVERADGTEQRATFCCGESAPGTVLLNGTAIRGGVAWQGDALLVETWVTVGARELHLRDYWSVSADGRTLSMEHRDGDLAGQLTVLDRVA